MSLFRRVTLPAVLTIDGRELPLIAERRVGARGIKLRADAVQGALRISLPMRGGVAEALALIDGHQGWLAKQIASWPQPIPFAPGVRIPFDGDTLLIDWAETHKRNPQEIGDRLLVGGPLPLLSARVLRWLKAAALADLAAATHEIAGVVDRPVAQVRVADTRARWGSCARGNGTGGRICYSWRLILAPTAIRRHIVAHEVAHLVHANHGGDFHALLARLDDGATITRAWLRRHGAGLHWVGRAA